MDDVLAVLNNPEVVAQKAKETLEYAKRSGIQLPEVPAKIIRSLARGKEIPVFVKEGVKFAAKVRGKYGRANPRTIFYTLVNKGLIGKSKRELDNLINWLTALRLIGVVPFDYIHDAGRIIAGGDFAYITPEAYVDLKLQSLENAWKYYCLPKWHGQRYYVEIWCEKLGLSDFINNALRDLNVKIRYIRGYAPWALVYKAAEEFKAIKDREIVILHLGDFDPSGEDIVRRAVESLKYFGFKITYRKVAVTIDQIEKFNLPEKPEGPKAKETIERALRDPRYKSFVEKWGRLFVVELDTLFTEEHIDRTFKMIREAVLEYFDKNIAEKMKAEEEKLKLKVKSMTEEIMARVKGVATGKHDVEKIMEVKERRGKLKVKGREYVKREGYLQLTLPVHMIGKKVRVCIDLLE